MIDADGYRPNVGIILTNAEHSKVLWARRCGQDAWQFPQGGIQKDESPTEAMYRELKEEVGLSPEHVTLIGKTQRWLRYRLPKRMVRHGSQPVCIGQKQIWFLLELAAGEGSIDLNLSPKPEFDGWQWVDYWLPMDEVVFFKRSVYRNALTELQPYLKHA